MSYLEIFLISLGLASDAFAVSICAGSTGIIKNKRAVFRLSFHFGLFQFLMPIVGWVAGLSISEYIQFIDHWIAFGLLMFVAIHMIKSASEDENNFEKNDPSNGMMLIILSIATSIDALAVGLSMAFLNISILCPSLIIGLVAGLSSFVGIFIGNKFSKKVGKRSVYFGGGILIFIAIKILLSHLLG